MQNRAKSQKLSDIVLICVILHNMLRACGRLDITPTSGDDIAVLNNEQVVYVTANTPGIL